MARISRVLLFLLKALCVIAVLLLFSVATFSVPTWVHILLTSLIAGLCAWYVILEKVYPYRNITAWLSQIMKFVLAALGIILFMLLLKLDRFASYNNWLGEYSDGILGLLFFAAVFGWVIGFQWISGLRETRETALIWAIKRGDTGRVKLLLRKGADPNKGFAESFYMLSMRDTFFTPLMLAASKGHSDITRILLQAGANVNARNEHGETALALAISEEHFETVKVLLSDSPDMNMKSEYVMMALEIATEYGWDDIVESMLERGVNPNRTTALVGAARSCNIQTVKSLLAAGVDINGKDENGDTALINAARNGRMDIVSLLISKGADINAMNKMRETALEQAEERGFTEIVQLLTNMITPLN